MTDSLTVFGTDYTGVTGIKAHKTSDSSLQAYIKPEGNLAITSNTASGSTLDVSQYATATVNVPGITPSGNINITQAGQTDVTNYATATVPEASQYIGIDKGYFTESNVLKWHVRGFAELDPNEGDQEGWVSEGTQNSDYFVFNAVPANTTITPTTSSQTVGGANYMMEGAVTVAAMPSGTAGTPTATKGTVSNHAISVTPSVTNTTGYITGGTKTGTAVSVSASELVSGTYTVSGSGTADVTNYASASVAAGSATASATKGTVSNHAITVTPSVTRTAGWVTAGSANGTAVSVSASELVSGSETKTANGTYDVTNLAELVVNVSGGGGSSVQIGLENSELLSASSSISFTGLQGEPTSFVAYVNADLSTGSPARVVAVVFDGTDLHGQTASTTSNANAHYDTGFTKSYSNGTLTLTATTAQFAAELYYLIYSYGGTAACIDTKDVQVGSGATSITFTGLEDEPMYWSCIFKSDFSTSNGYQRVMFVTDNDGEVGSALDSSAHHLSSWTASYSNGSFTITSGSTNNGGYFHQPGYYQLTYAYDATGNYQSKTVTPTTSQQIVTADSGYDALKKVTVNAIPNTYVQPTSTIGATTYRASTSNQTIQAGTYHSAAATIAAVTATNLDAGNIKNGTTITISNGQSNLWSVTGTYTGSGGGGSSTVATATATASGRPTSLAFTVSGQPIAFFCRCTSAMSRSSNSTYYYVADMRYDGSNVRGNCWRMSNGNWTNITSGYSQSYSNGTLTLTSSGTSTSSPGSFYNNGSYELVYVY